MIACLTQKQIVKYLVFHQVNRQDFRFIKVFEWIDMLQVKIIAGPIHN